jgi:hypothetical protein
MPRWSQYALALFTTAGLFLIASPPAWANQEDDSSVIAQAKGDWESMRSRQQVRDKIDKRVETFLAELPFYKRPFARPRLKTATEACWTISIERPDPDSLSIQCNNDNPVVSPDDGSQSDWTSKDGDSYKVTQTVKDDKIVQVFESDSGTRTNRYEIDGDNMKLHIRLASPQLPIDLTYTRFFERSE